MQASTVPMLPCAAGPSSLHQPLKQSTRGLASGATPERDQRNKLYLAVPETTLCHPLATCGAEEGEMEDDIKPKKAYMGPETQHRGTGQHSADHEEQGACNLAKAVQSGTLEMFAVFIRVQ